MKGYLQIANMQIKHKRLHPLKKKKKSTVVLILCMIASQLVTIWHNLSVHMFIQNNMFFFSLCVQNDRYTVGGSEKFDTLTDLVEYYKREGIEEISGNWVYLKQVNWTFSFSFQMIKNRGHVKLSEWKRTKK